MSKNPIEKSRDFTKSFESENCKVEEAISVENIAVDLSKEHTTNHRQEEHSERESHSKNPSENRAAESKKDAEDYEKSILQRNSIVQKDLGQSIDDAAPN